MTVRRCLGAGIVLTLLALCTAYPAWHLQRVAAAIRSDTALIDALLEARSALQTHLLSARAGLELSFDDVNAAVLELRSVDTDAVLARGLASDSMQGADQLAQAAAALRVEEGAIETFKTDLALLRLSSQYFPVAGDALARHANVTLGCAKQPAASDAVDAISALRASVARYEAAPSPELAKRLEAAIVALSALGAKLGDDDDSRENLSALLAHARVIVDRRARVDAFARSTVRSSARTHLAAARAAYDRAARRPLAATALLRPLASILAALGFIAFGLAAWQAARSAHRTLA